MIRSSRERHWTHLRPHAVKRSIVGSAQESYAFVSTVSARSKWLNLLQSHALTDYEAVRRLGICRRCLRRSLAASHQHEKSSTKISAATPSSPPILSAATLGGLSPNVQISVGANQRHFLDRTSALHVVHRECFTATDETCSCPIMFSMRRCLRLIGVLWSPVCILGISDRVGLAIRVGSVALIEHIIQSTATISLNP